MLRHPRSRAALGIVAISLGVAVVWWVATPAGLAGSLAGTCMVTGVMLFFVGMFLGAGGDRVLDNLLPGANVGRMAEQGQTAERRFLAPRPRWSGVIAMAAGAAYLALGVLLWQWR